MNVSKKENFTKAFCAPQKKGKIGLDVYKRQHENIQFLLVLTCILKAVDKHADLLRESAADVGNDQRLGGHEAPPAVISVFLGEQLEDCLLYTSMCIRDRSIGLAHIYQINHDILLNFSCKNSIQQFA